MNASETHVPERGRTLVLLLILLNTVLAAAISALQVDATIRASQSNRDSQYAAIRITGLLIQTGARSDYDLKTFSLWLVDSQQSLIAQSGALQRQDANDQAGSESLLLQSQVAQARADRARHLSVLLTDPAYAPASDQGLPNTDAYLSGLSAPATDLLKQQNAASDAYHRWSSKSDSYVAVLTVLAVAFFLLGIAQAGNPDRRMLFCVFGIVVISIAVIWALVLLFS